MTADASDVRVTVQNQIAEIALSRAPLNAFSIAFLDNILTALKEAGDDPDTRAIIIRSDLPNVFSAGLDLDLIIDQPAATVRAFLQRLYIDLYDVQYKMPKPTIAAIK
ncbi:MAG: enoyl-CoA hydratase/isomerase family protein, partial [Pseudomonadota bacterium]